MIENDLDKVLNYMKQYVENVYEHDSEPMLNWKDLKLVLEEIERLNNIINELDTFLKNKIDNFDEDVKDTILHEQMTIKVIYDYLQILKGDSNE